MEICQHCLTPQENQPPFPLSTRKFCFFCKILLYLKQEIF